MQLGWILPILSLTILAVSGIGVVVLAVIRRRAPDVYERLNAPMRDPETRFRVTFWTMFICGSILLGVMIFVVVLIFAVLIPSYFPR